MVFPSSLITSPVGVPTGVPCSALKGASSEPGIVLVCHAGTSFTEPQSNVTVPPRFGSWTSAPRSPSQFAISQTATHGAPVRVATGTASAMWSACPWLTSTWVASTSSAVATALGLLGFRKGSTRTVAEPSLSSKQEWPWYLISISSSVWGWWRNLFAALVQMQPERRAVPEPLVDRISHRRGLKRRGVASPLARLEEGGCHEPRRKPAAPVARVGGDVIDAAILSGINGLQYTRDRAVDTCLVEPNRRLRGLGADRDAEAGALEAVGQIVDPPDLRRARVPVPVEVTDLGCLEVGQPQGHRGRLAVEGVPGTLQYGDGLGVVLGHPNGPRSHTGRIVHCGQFVERIRETRGPFVRGRVRDRAIWRGGNDRARHAVTLKQPRTLGAAPDVDQPHPQASSLELELAIGVDHRLRASDSPSAMPTIARSMRSSSRIRSFS